MVDSNEIGRGVVSKEIITEVRGRGAYSRLKIRVRCPPRPARGRSPKLAGAASTPSTATVAVLPKAEERDLVIDPAEIRIESTTPPATAARTSKRSRRQSG